MEEVKRKRGERGVEGRPQRAMGNPPVHRKSDRESQRNARFKAELVNSADELGNMDLNRSHIATFSSLLRHSGLGRALPPSAYRPNVHGSWKPHYVGGTETVPGLHASEDVGKETEHSLYLN